MTELVIITGVYGAGKTTAVLAFEEAGYFITDNIPVGVVDAYLTEIAKNPERYPKVALTVDLEYAEETYKIAKKHHEFKLKFFGVTCEESELIERYRLSRKLHQRVWRRRRSPENL